MNKLVKGVAIAAFATVAMTGAANAAVSIAFGSYQVGVNPGEYIITDFNAPVTYAPGFAGSGGSLLTGTSGLGSAPAFDPVNRDPTQYLSVKGGELFTFTGPARQSVSLYIGSLDDYNSITFHFFSGASQVVSGLTLGGVSGAANGNQTAANTNGRFTFTSAGDYITGFDLSSTQNSFEVSNIGAAIPEPATWAMMIIGFGGVGAMLRGARRKQALALA